MRRYERGSFPKSQRNKADSRRPKRSSAVPGNHDIELGEKCLECGGMLDADAHPLLVSPYGYACGTGCAESYGRKRRHFLDVVIRDPKLASKWLRGEDFPSGDCRRRRFSRPQGGASGPSSSSGRQSQPPS